MKSKKQKVLTFKKWKMLNELQRSPLVEPSLARAFSIEYYRSMVLRMLIVRPFYVMVNPTVLWALVIIALTSTWIVLISFTITQAFYGPPYSFTIPQQGYISAGPLVGGFLGCIPCGLICDPMARYLARRTKGFTNRSSGYL
jgi:hypothetical protein